MTTGGVTFARVGRFEVRLNGPSVGSQYDQLTVGGSAILAGNLDILASPGLATGTTFTILNKTSSGAITGFFAGKTQEAVFGASGYAWLINYTGGGGTEVTVTIQAPRTSMEEWSLQHFNTIVNTGNHAHTIALT